MLGNDDCGLGGARLPSLRCELGKFGGELLELDELRLWVTSRVGQPEVELVGMVTIGVFVAQVVEIAVVPGNPSTTSGKQRRVEDLAVVVGPVLPGGEVGAHAELLEDDRLVEGARQLANKRRCEALADLVVKHGVHVRSYEIDHWCESPERVAIVTPRHLDPPRTVTGRHRLGRS